MKHIYVAIFLLLFFSYSYSQKPCPGLPTISYEGQTYNTVAIGSQCWLKENLDVGTMIPGVDTAKNNGIIEKYCYNDSIENCDKYGGLYQWNEAMQYQSISGTQGVCPTGWHIATAAEYQTLVTTVGWNGNALKGIGQGTGDGAGTNTSGFTSLLTGSRYEDGSFNYLGSSSVYWSSTEISDARATSMDLYDGGSGITFVWGPNKSNGFSVRCMNDLSISSINSQNPCPGLATVNYEGRTYHTVAIGTQCWLKENLDVGTMIHGIDTAKNNGIIEKYCYNDDPANCMTYGGLYQWAEAVAYTNGATNTSSPSPAFTGNIGGICPNGWHIPTYTEYETLVTTVGWNGNALKEIGQGTGSGAGTNTSGFTSLLTGSRYEDGSFNYLGSSSVYWSSTEISDARAISMDLYDGGSGITFVWGPNKSNGFSVRCMNDWHLLSLTLTTLIQGLYNGSSMVSDTVAVELRNTSSPYTLVESENSVLDSTGTGKIFFKNGVNSTPYFLVIKHRNAVETWSYPQYFWSDTLSFDMTSSNKAYGGNMVYKGSKWCIYSGDVNQDGVIDSGDLGIVDNDNASYVSGYVNTDVNGDGIVDSSDLGIVDNNNAAYVGKIVPTGAPTAIRIIRTVKTNKQK